MRAVADVFSEVRERFLHAQFQDYIPQWINSELQVSDAWICCQVLVTGKESTNYSVE